jgi:hypothetical protein
VYCLDWDSTERLQTIAVENASSFAAPAGSPLTARAVSEYEKVSGEYRDAGRQPADAGELGDERAIWGVERAEADRLPDRLGAEQ